MSRPVLDRLEPRLLLMAQLVADLAPGVDSSLATPWASVGDTVFFTANLNSREELWKSDGTAAGTTFVKALQTHPSDAPTDWAAANGRVFFAFQDGEKYELWASDGSSVGTILLHEINWPTTAAARPPSDPAHLVAAGDRVYFLYRPDPATLELWRSDGTPGGTARVKAFDDSDPAPDFGGVDINGTFYFKHGDLWKSDGTEAGTALVDLSPGPADSLLYGLANVNGTLFFAGTLTLPNNQVSSGVFRSDGTAAGTVNVAPVSTRPETFEMEVVGDSVYFPATTTDVLQLDLWKSDGTQAGTGVAFAPRPGVVNPHYLTRVGDNLFFFAEGGANGQGLWKTNGTDAGTRLVTTVDPASASAPYPYPPGNVVESNGKLLFADSGRGLWQSDGTVFGTGRVEGLTSVHNLVRNGIGDGYFAATTTSAGGELWRFDATEPPSAHVLSRHILYNNSAYDGNNAAANAQDDAAFDNRKQPLLPGGTASFANVSTYTRGINGITVDIDGLPADIVLTPGDFTFRTGSSPDTGTWVAAPDPVSVTVRPHAGQGGSDRVTLIWNDYDPVSAAAGTGPAGRAVANAWLEVTVNASQRTGLLRPDLFYVGSLIGETSAGAATDRRTVDVLDYFRTRALIDTAANIGNPFDFNRDKKVDALDVAVVRANLGRSLATITAVEFAAPLPAAPAQVSIVAPASAGATELVRRRTGYRPAL